MFGRGFIESFEPRRMLSAFVVNSVADTHDANPGDGIAADADGQTTLRAAIEEANALVGADTIQLPSGTIEIGRDIVQSILVTEEVRLVGSGTSASVIDGEALNRVFEVKGQGRLSLSNVVVQEAHDLAASLRSNLLTTNARQAELVVAFANPVTALVSLASRDSNGLSPLVGIAVTESVLDETPLIVAERMAKADDTTEKPKQLDHNDTEPSAVPVPTAESAFEDIINALFQRDRSTGVKPAGAEQQPTPKTEGTSPQSIPNSNAPSNSESSDETFLDTDEECESANDAMAAVLQSWSDDSSWSPHATGQLGTATVATRTSAGRRVSAMVGMVLAGVVANSWETSSGWLRASKRLGSWRQRLARLRRKAR